jgi:hypothetical protein
MQMSTIMKASHQWATRPADQRFISLTDLNEYVHAVRDSSRAKAVSSRAITAQPLDDDNKGLAIVGPNGAPALLTHWSFGQLAQRAGAPAGYLRDLPAPMAADCLNYGLHIARNVEDVNVLLARDDSGTTLRAVTGPNYGRVWNATITQALVDRFGDGLNGQFRVPGEFGEAVEVTKDNTTLYGSDRDIFIFLADEQHKIEVPNRRDGKPGMLSRGFMVWNSEVGSATLGISTFLFDYVCCNRIVWGAQNVQQISIRHTSGAPDRWVEEVAPAIESYAESSTAGITRLIADARAKRIDDVDAFLANRFTRSQVTAIKASHIADEQRPIETIWDASTAITAYARGIDFQDARVGFEREAGKVLNLAMS